MKPIDTRSDEELADLIRRSRTLEDAPEHAVRAAVALWPVANAPTVGALVRSAVDRLRAVLTIDSWAPGDLALGVRSVPSDTRQLLFSADGRDIDVRVSPSRPGFTITGQILGPDASGAVELMTSGHAEAAAAVATGTLDELGEFHLSGIEPGRYTLLVRSPSVEIELPPFDVGDRQR
jgi:hypothetical protein